MAHETGLGQTALRRLEASVPWLRSMLLRDVLFAALDVELAGDGLRNAVAEDVVEWDVGFGRGGNTVYTR